jgi:hypothetical protein
MSNFNFNSAVPSADTADNVLTSDVIGNKTDTVAGNSVVSHARRINEGGHAISSAPNQAAAISCTDSNGTGAFTPGSWVELDDGTGVPSNPFKIVGICFDTPSAAMIAEISIGVGAAASEVEVIGGVHVEVATDAGGYQPIFLPPSTAIAGGTRVAARIGTAADSGQTLKVKVLVQEI